MKRKIVIIVNNICQMGGIEQVISLLSSRWKDVYTVTIYSIYSKDEAIPYFPFDNEINIIHMNRKVPRTMFDRLKEMSLFRNIIKEQSNSYIITCQGDISIEVLLNRKWSKLSKYIVTEHSAYDSASRKRHFLEDIFYRKADAVIALTKHDKEKYEHSLNNVYVIPNPVTWENTIVNENKEKIILAVGRLEVVKGFDRLIKAASIALQDNDWKLWIVGDGSEKEKLQKLICELECSGKVLLLGSCHNVKALMERASIFALSSYFESFSLALLEAMECGLVPVCMSCTGPEEIIEDGITGFLTEQDINDFAMALQSCIHDSEMQSYIRRNAKETVRRYYSASVLLEWDKVFRAIEADKR